MENGNGGVEFDPSEVEKSLPPSSPSSSKCNTKRDLVEDAEDSKHMNENSFSRESKRHLNSADLNGKSPKQQKLCDEGKNSSTVRHMSLIMPSPLDSGSRGASTGGGAGAGIGSMRTLQSYFPPTNESSKKDGETAVKANPHVTKASAHVGHGATVVPVPKVTPGETATMIERNKQMEANKIAREQLEAKVSRIYPVVADRSILLCFFQGVSSRNGLENLKWSQQPIG